jgi:fructuronate reductase/mannitol 2-dehydrogenase
MSTPLRAPARHSQSLSNATLSKLGAHVRVPSYDRATITPAIVHIGVGGFHRAHQAVYLDELAERGISTDWGVIGVALRHRAMKDALEPQDGLFTVVERDDEQDVARVVGSIAAVLFAPEEPEAVLTALSDPQTRIVTLTITGNGYHLDPETGRLADGADVRADLAEPARPRTALGYLVESLDRRRRAGIRPFTVLSCDNVPDNGATAHLAVVGLAEARDPELAAWIDAEVAFPRTMVDRITPETGADAYDLVGRSFGVDDRWPVVTEPFSQWIVEDRFCNGRPPLEEVGVQFVDDVEPYERMKKRLLNASHSALGYVGYLLGHRDTAGAMTDPLMRSYLDRLMEDEIAPLLPQVPGVDLDEYRATLLTRFSNGKVGDQLERLCGRGSTKVPAYLLPSIVEARQQARPHELLNLAVAAWVRYLRGVDLDGREISIKDARLDELQPMAIAGGDDPAPFMANSRVFGWLADDPMLVRSVARILTALERDGLRPTVEAFLRAEAGRLAA